ncbi:hypothetical protein [Actinoplanes flavus]|uniref:Uncharacterized protein n=1 Tax=Actinoplanes flavus TaxID=2820290 RepID=A0ABS3UQY2_9ACTN|nr:hypothetical protein [Actinoplanes flavus]MBO3741185.1 hypothetical protein [Actinoplanes flavus]
MQALGVAGDRRRGGQWWALDGDDGGELAGSGGDPAEVDGRFGEADRGAAEGGRRRGGDPAFAGGEPPQRRAGLDGAGQVLAGGRDRELGDLGHLVAALAADPGQVRLPARPEHPLPHAGVAFAQVVVEFADADPAVPVAVGGAGDDAVGDEPGEGGWFGPGGGGDDDAALPLGGPRRAEVVPGVDGAAGPPVEQDDGLSGPAPLHEGGHLRHVDRGVGGPAHHRVGGGEVEPAAGPGQHDATEVDEDAVVLLPAVEDRLDSGVRLARPGIS